MAGYGAFQRARKSFGSRRGMRRSNYSRSGRIGYKKIGSTIKPRFATVGFARNVEKNISIRLIRQILTNHLQVKLLPIQVITV